MGACVYWKAEFPLKGGVEGTRARKHLAEHQETGWAGPTLLKKLIIFPSPPITGASIITSSRGAHFRGLAFTSCTQSPNHFLSVWVSRPSGPAKGSFQPCWGVIPISLSLTPSLVQSVWHWVKAQGASVRWTSASFYFPMSFPSPKKVKALAYKTGSQSLIPA